MALVRDMTAALRRLFPGCPAPDAASIAGHTAVRGSGRGAVERVLEGWRTPAG